MTTNEQRGPVPGVYGDWILMSPGAQRKAYVEVVDELERLRAALAPFAAAIHSVPKGWADCISWGRHTCGDYRRAAQAAEAMSDHIGEHNGMVEPSGKAGELAERLQEAADAKFEAEKLRQRLAAAQATSNEQGKVAIKYIQLYEQAAARLSDIDNAVAFASEEGCGDERHCACVPLLRVELEWLRAERLEPTLYQQRLHEQLDSCRALLREACEQTKPSEWTTEYIAVLSRQWFDRARAAGGDDGR